MYNLLLATRLEINDSVRRARKTAIGGATKDKVSVVNNADQQALVSIGRTKVGQGVGAGARSVGKFMAELPILTLPSEAVSAYECIDILAKRVRERPENPLARIQLAEGLEAAQRDRVMIRLLRQAADPTALLTSSIFRIAASLGASKETPVKQQIRAAFGLINAKAKSGKSISAEELLTLSRVYRLSGKPGLGVRYAVESARRAAKAEQELPAEEPRQSLGKRLSKAWKRGSSAGGGGFSGFLGALEAAVDTADEVTQAAIDRGFDRIDARFSGDLSLLNRREALRKQQGAAWTAAGWAFVDLGDYDSARAVANRALQCGFSCGHDILAAAYDGNGQWFGSRIKSRFEMLQNAKHIDRNYYRGASRSNLWAGGSIVGSEISKAKRAWDWPAN